MEDSQINHTMSEPIVTTFTLKKKRINYQNCSVNMEHGQTAGERKQAMAAERDEETQAAKAKLLQYEALGHIKVEMDEISEDLGDVQPDDAQATMVIPSTITTVSQESILAQPRVGGMVDVPILTDMEGKHGFNVSVDDKERSTKSPMWLMSPIVNKLYTNLNKAVPFEVRMKTPPMDGEKLYIRATLVFSSPEFLRTNVTRCPNHAATTEATNHDFPYPDHVVRADHPGALYQKSASGRLSVIIPLDLQHNGPDYALILLRFMCLGSCVGGISRRPISIVLTIENRQAEVLGRKVIDVRVCACPTRDIRTDEQAVSNRGFKRKGSLTLGQQVIKKKPKMVEPKFEPYEGTSEVFNIKVHGRQLYNFMVNMMRVYYNTHPEYQLRFPDPSITVNSFGRQNATNAKEKGSKVDIEANNTTVNKSAGSSPVHDGNLVIDSQESPPHSSPSQLDQDSIPSTVSLVVMNRETNGLDSVSVQHSSIKSTAQSFSLNSIPVLSSPAFSATKMVPILPALTSGRSQLATTHNDNVTPSNGNVPRHVPVVQVLRAPPLRRVNSDSKLGSMKQSPIYLKNPIKNNVVPANMSLDMDSSCQEEEQASHDSEEILAANVLAGRFTKKSRK